MSLKYQKSDRPHPKGNEMNWKWRPAYQNKKKYRIDGWNNMCWYPLLTSKDIRRSPRRRCNAKDGTVSKKTLPYLQYSGDGLWLTDRCGIPLILGNPWCGRYYHTFHFIRLSVTSRHFVGKPVPKAVFLVLQDKLLLFSRLGDVLQL